MVDTYDEAAFDRFCSDLVHAGFSPSGREDEPYWTGPIRASLTSLTSATRMRIDIREGWPLLYAQVVVKGLRSDHDDQGLICLWADDDPAQIGGRTLRGLLERLDDWADTARAGFRVEDRALDAHRFFERASAYNAELPLGDLIDRSTYGSSIELHGRLRGATLMIDHSNAPDARTVGAPVLHGLFHLIPPLPEPPRTVDEVRTALSRKQRRKTDQGLSARTAAAFPQPSGGLDFVVIAWRRHGAEHDAVVLGVDGDRGSRTWSALPASPNDVAALRRRAGPDAGHLADRRVVIVGTGSVGGHVAVTIASSGVGQIHLHDNDRLTSANLVRHVATEHFVGYPKTVAVTAMIKQHAPWTTVVQHGHLSYAPDALSQSITDADLVIDCTGMAPLTAAVAEICRRTDTPLVSGALFHHGSLVRVQRQAAGDTPIAARPSDTRYHALPPDVAAANTGFLELGCTAPVNNAPPISVLTAAADTAAAALDLLTGRRERPDERTTVMRAMLPPFDRIGAVLDPMDSQ